ncbi:hypothetical protein DPMN_150614 [Dreissena polymorpha]|uniref:Uncharacterized protein n=1 Tax=Dreissena polymorpha TaxID=45954 RepID=A0A9D4FG18_DREPO|nr:hypothetical protein DPMN_150614 [Dreissena polymorpha]
MSTILLEHEYNTIGLTCGNIEPHNSSCSIGENIAFHHVTAKSKLRQIMDGAQSVRCTSRSAAYTSQRKVLKAIFQYHLYKQINTCQ